MPVLEITGGILLALLALGLLSVLGKILDGASSQITNGFELRRTRLMHSDWRALQSLSIGLDGHTDSETDADTELD